MRYIISRSGVILFLISGLVISGCVATNPSQPAKFYQLSALSKPIEGAKAQSGEGCFAIGVGPVEIAEYLNRSQIVLRTNEIELTLDEFNKWAEPLEDTLTRVLAENLANLLCTDPIAIYPSRGYITLDYKVEVEVLRLDGDLGKDIKLITRWAILGKERDELLVVRRSTYTESTKDNTHKTLVLAKSRALEKLSEEIATAIKELIAGKSKSS